MASINSNMFSNNKNVKINHYDVPEKGSLGLLAFGAQGIRAWKMKKKERSENNLDKQSKENPKVEPKEKE
jgi:hypothetical protein